MKSFINCIILSFALLINITPNLNATEKKNVFIVKNINI